MKIYRGPHTSKKWEVTDTRRLAKWAKDWQPGKQLVFDGTIEKAGQRHTDLGVELEPGDIAPLHNAYQRFQKKRLRTLEKRDKELSETVEFLETAVKKIDNLLRFHRDQAPNTDELLKAVQQIAHQLRFRSTRKKPVKLKWIKWESI